MHLSIYFFSALRSEKVTISTANKLLVKMGRAKINYFRGKSKQYCFVRWKLRAFNAFISPLWVLGYLGYIVLPSWHIFNVLCSLKGLCYIEATCALCSSVAPTQLRIVVPAPQLTLHMMLIPLSICPTIIALRCNMLPVSCKLGDRDKHFVMICMRRIMCPAGLDSTV